MRVVALGAGERRPIDRQPRKEVSCIQHWEEGEVQPTLKQLETFAKTTRVAIGLLFLNEPPDEPLPIPDFRTMQGHAIDRPSPDLRDMIYACQPA